MGIDGDEIISSEIPGTNPPVKNRCGPVSAISERASQCDAPLSGPNSEPALPVAINLRTRRVMRLFRSTLALLVACGLCVMAGSCSKNVEACICNNSGVALTIDVRTFGSTSTGVALAGGTSAVIPLPHRLSITHSSGSRMTVLGSLPNNFVERRSLFSPNLVRLEIEADFKVHIMPPKSVLPAVVGPQPPGFPL